MDIQRINPSEKWSDVTVFNKMAHFVEVPADETADMLGQVEQVFAQAEAMLASVNSDKSRLVSVTIYVTDFANLSILNDAWIKWLPEGCAPSRACLKVELADPDYLVEIAFVAAVK
ncbi:MULTISPECIES: RidA family protein [Aliivibrio]|uniref:RidA family protein n=1 Tax=Aliivibrio finisterrensis TaxID=511998 RepID=A0A4Q5KQD6_9GAMM|nr:MULTISPECIES: RidA family protein [Aliivibrio]MDD9178757.1 RidA family protein [Aliivibrio sp. A6]RYU48904.1 RidA family protein [Aliivibrio finisterrensis]RYU55191.1 RidA family protein [Aliivibrio finisterrensis]RYU59850.1 RidA family protein [Aliivibrio finisterrensis]RYU65716.1 RidA family protein [Aliivibrio finisterrensis]